MKAAVTEQDGRTHIKTLSTIAREKDHAIIRVAAAGLCGTDRHIASGEFPAKFPRVLGHEISGLVEWIDDAGDSFKVHDPVVIDPNISCFRCEFCREGLVHLCSRRKAVGIDLDGGFAEFVSVPVSQLYRLASSTPLYFGSLAEPLSCCVHGVDQLDIRSGKKVAVVGLGPVGILLSQLLLLQGVTEIVGFDSSCDRVERASTTPIQSEHWDNREQYPDNYFDAVVDAVGSSSVFEWGLNAVRPGGKILVFGVAPQHQRANISLFQLYQKEITIVSAYTNPLTMQRAVNLLDSGKINAELVLTNPIRLDAIPEMLGQPQTSGLKIFVNFD